MSFLIANWKYVLIGLLVILLGWSKITIANLEAKNTKLVYQVKTWQDSFSNLKQVADRCTESVNDYEAKTKQAKLNALEVIKKYEAKSKVQQDIIKAINARNVSNRDNRTCEQGVNDAKGDLK